MRSNATIVVSSMTNPKGSSSEDTESSVKKKWDLYTCQHLLVCTASFHKIQRLSEARVSGGNGLRSTESERSEQKEIYKISAQRARR